MQRAELLVCNQGRDFFFRFNAHCAHSIEELQIEPEFYGHCTPGLKFPGTHYELEILNDPLAFKVIARKHWHLSKKTNKMYVCYVRQIETERQIVANLGVWGCGVLYSEATLQDFAPGGDLSPGFMEMLTEKYNIRPLGVRFLQEGERFSS